MKVLFLTPMTSELRPFVTAAGLEKAANGRHEGRIGQVDATAALIGVGPAAARVSTRTLLEEVRPDHVVVVGIAGGVDSGLQIGDLVVPAAVLDELAGPERHPAGFGGATQAGTVLTSAEVIVAADEVAALRARGVVAVEMESAAVGEVCEARGLPWSVFRSISDRLDDGLIDSAVAGLVRPDGKPDMGAVLRLLARHPSRVKALGTLARDSQTAARAAAEAAVAACRRL